MNLRWIPLLALLAASFNVAAQDTDVCNSCGPVALEGRAKDLGNGDHYIFDLTYRRLTHLRVTGMTSPLALRNNASIASIKAPTVTNIPLTSDEQALYSATQTIYDLNGSLNVVAQSYVDVEDTFVNSGNLTNTRASLFSTPMATPSGKITAFDVIVNNQAMELAINQTTNNGSGYFNSFTVRLRAELSNLSMMWSKILPVPPINITNKITFPDGSNIIVQWNYNLQKYEYILGSAKDGVGNPIPTSRAAASGEPNSSHQEYTFPPTADGWTAGLSQIDNLNRMGITTSLPSGVQINNGFTIACTSVGGGTSVCEIILIRSM